MKKFTYIIAPIFQFLQKNPVKHLFLFLPLFYFSFTAIFPSAVYADHHNLIADIKVKGNKKIDSGAILNRVKSKTGDEYDAKRLTDDLKNIFQMGYFDDIQIDVSKSPQGNIVTFVVKERAVMRKVLIENNKNLKDKEINEVVTLKPNRIFNTKELKESLDNIKKLYKEKGYYNSKVTSSLNYPQKGQVEVRFIIDEGSKVYVKEITIVGNATFSDRKLKKVMITSEKGLFSWFTESGVLKRDMLEHDTARLTAFYHDNGFIEAKVGEPEMTHKDEWLYITFNVSEGKRYTVGKINLRGDLIADEGKLLGFVKLKNEKYFSRKTLREDILRLTDYYAEKGYAFAEAFPSLEKNEANLSVDLVLEIRKGQLVRLNRIIIKGNTRTRDKVIRRKMDVKEGGLYDAAAIRRSNQQLQRLNYFEEVNVSPQPTLEDDLMDVLVEVKEKPTGNFSIGAGYSSVDHLIFMSEISQSNFLGRGQRLSLQANISGSSTRYNLSFTEPHIFDSKLSTGIDLYDWEREYDDWTTDSQGFGLNFSYPLWRKWFIYWGYGYDHTVYSNVEATAAQEILDSLDINITNFIRLGFQRDTRNRAYDASEGARYSFSTKHAGGELGGDSSFTKLEGNVSLFFPTFWKTIFHVRLAGGYVRENEKGKLPVKEKFYLGGINTIRGFEPGDISPKETVTIIDPITLEKITTEDRIGGNKMWYSNIEFIFPLVPDAGLKGLIFYDVGNVYDFEEDWDFDRIKQSVGYGFRWLSPMGPLRLEWGYNLDPEGDEQQSSWDFTIGGSF